MPRQIGQILDRILKDELVWGVDFTRRGAVATHVSIGQPSALDVIVCSLHKLDAVEAGSGVVGVRLDNHVSNRVQASCIVVWIENITKVGPNTVREIVG